jgi:hypothetical protein
MLSGRTVHVCEFHSIQAFRDSLATAPATKHLYEVLERGFKAVLRSNTAAERKERVCRLKIAIRADIPDRYCGTTLP